MKHESAIRLVVAIVLVFVATTTRASVRQDRDFPKTGVITNPSRNNLVVREYPPDVTAFSYKLAEKVCSVGVGTIFEAIKEVRIINGEVWYRVHIDNMDISNPSPDWDGNDIEGWIAGRIKKTWVVSFLPEDIKRYSRRLTAVRMPELSPDPEDGRTIVVEAATEAEEESSEPDSSEYFPPAGEEPGDIEFAGPLTGEEEDTAVVDTAEPVFGTGEYVDSDQGGFSILLRYLLLLLGSCTAVVVLAIEKNQSLNIKKWFSPIIPFEFVILGLANIIFVALLLNTFVERSGSSIVFECISVFAGPNFGFVFLGFIISVLLLKFMAFARK
ncbi:MAG: hypothetical protein KOO63_14115 [Bacteroidales bacterium]|nr:hypothetical protein [Candidatus Latescibacterota bacterium]